MTPDQDPMRGGPSMRDIAKSMPTPRTPEGTIALFTALELAEVEEGKQTLEGVKDTLRSVVEGAREQADAATSSSPATERPPREPGESFEEYETRVRFGRR